MKTKIKLVVLFIFLFSASHGQTHWAQLSPIEPGGDQLITAYSINFDNQNVSYVAGESFDFSHTQVWKFDGQSWQNLCFAGWGNAKIVFDKNNELWTAGYEWIGRYDSITMSSVYMGSGPALNLENHYDITVDQNNSKWILGQCHTLGCSINIFKFDGSNWTEFDSTTTDFYWETTPLRIVAANTTPNVFVFGRLNCIVKYDGANWSKIDASNSNMLDSLSFYDVKMDGNDHLWMTASRAGQKTFMMMYDGVQFHYYYPPTSIPDFTYLTIDPSGIKWGYIHMMGLVKFDGTNWSVFNCYQDANWILPSASLTSDLNGIIYCADDGVNFQPLTLFNENGFQTINGNVFKDANTNGIKDVNENGMQHEMVRSSEGMITLSDSAGDYHLFFTDSANTVSVTHNLIPYRYHSTLPTSYSVNPLTQSTSGYDFGVADILNLNDLQIYCNMYPTRPGFTSYGGIDYYNIGTTTLSDTITLQLDGRYTFLNSNPAPTLITGNKLQWLYTNLAPLDYGHISLSLRLDSTAVIGDTLFSLATIGPIVNDTVPTDNIDYIYKVVHGSYDPNEKEVEPKGFGPNGNIPNGQTLNYTIHFQNTGTDTAFTVTVKDTLSSNLDINTFQFIGSSHPCIYEITGTGNMKFTFYNILLTDTFTNEQLSHGYVSYKIKAIDNLPLGTQIKNTAFIYFDFNQPIVTNTTLNTIANTTGIPFVKNNYSANVFPNPLQEVATLEINGTNVSSKLTVKLFDAMGREINVAVSKLDNNRFAIHRNDLTSGLYFYQVSDGNVLISSGKITVQ
jgi:uncharacterized repeat protein (TIGR01451 family)